MDETTIFVPPLNNSDTGMVVESVTPKLNSSARSDSLSYSQSSYPNGTSEEKSLQQECLSAKVLAATTGIDLQEAFNSLFHVENNSGLLEGYVLNDKTATSINFTSLCNFNNTGLIMDTSMSSDEGLNFTSDSDLLEYYLGSKYRSLGESWLLTFIYCGIFLTGIIGNISTCIVICKNNYMHTATNYYLFSLAISDVLTLILGLPPELYAVWEAYPWRFGEPYCLFKTFLTEMTSSASILTITAFTVERYVAICHPIRAQRMSSLPRAVKSILFIWIAACLSAVPYPIHTRLYYYIPGNLTKSGLPLEESLICNIPPYWMPKMRPIFQFSTFLLFIFPMTVITVLYLMIGITLKKAGLARKSSAENCTHNSHQSRKIIQMLVAVVVAFFICWAPFHAQRLMTSYITRDDQWTPELHSVQNILWYISGVLYFVSSTVNPILYNLMSRKYRQAFKETLCKGCFKQSTSSLNGYTNNRTRGAITADKSTIYSYYSQSSNKKYSSMLKKESHILTNQKHCNNRIDNNNLHTQSLLLQSPSNQNHMDMISENSPSDTKEINNSCHILMEPLVSSSDTNLSDHQLQKTNDDIIVPNECADIAYNNTHSDSVTALNEETPLNHNRTSSTKSAANGSLVSGCSLKSSPAVLAEHLKEELDMSNMFEETDT